MTHKTLIVQQYPLGPMDNFIYLLGDTQKKEAVIVDPAWDATFLWQELNRLDLSLTGIFLTHGHFDHLNALDDILKKKEVPVYLSELEAPQLTPSVANLIRTKEGDTLPVGTLQWDVFLTPGHSPGGQCFKYNKHLVTGDTLFVQGCGRADLPGSDPEALWKSLQRLKALPDDTIVYAGHNYGKTITDTIGHMKTHNMFLRLTQKDQFLSNR